MSPNSAPLSAAPSHLCCYSGPKERFHEENRNGSLAAFQEAQRTRNEHRYLASQSDSQAVDRYCHEHDSFFDGKENQLDRRAALRDLRSIRGLSPHALVKVDYSLGDVLEWLKEASITEAAYKSHAATCWRHCFLPCWAKESFHTLQRTDSELPELEEDDPVVSLDKRAFFKWSQRNESHSRSMSALGGLGRDTSIAEAVPTFTSSRRWICLIYLAATVIHTTFLLVMYFKVWESPAFQDGGFALFKPISTFVSTSPLLQLPTTQFETYPFVALRQNWDSETAQATRLRSTARQRRRNVVAEKSDFSDTFMNSGFWEASRLRRFEIYFTVACIPMPLIFAMCIYGCCKLMQRVIHAIFDMICDHVRRTVNMASRQAADISLHDYIRRIEYFFFLKKTFRPTGLNSLYKSLHTGFDSIVHHSLRYGKQQSSVVSHCRWSRGEPPLRRLVWAHTKDAWNCLFYGFYAVPTVMSFLMNYGAVIHVLKYCSLDGCRFGMSETETIVGQTARGPFMFDDELYIVLETVAFNILSWVWLLVLLADDFWGFILNCSGMFNCAADTASAYANHLVKRVWDVTVVKGVLPYIIWHKDPDYRWGDLHQDLVDAIERVAHSKGVKVPEESQEFRDMEEPCQHAGHPAFVPSKGAARMKEPSYPSLRSHYRASLEGANGQREPLLVEKSVSESADYKKRTKTPDLQRNGDEENERSRDRMDTVRGPETEGDVRGESRKFTTRRPASAEIFNRDPYENFKWDPMASVERRTADTGRFVGPKDNGGKSTEDILRSGDSSAMEHNFSASAAGESRNSVFVGRESCYEDSYHPLPTESRWEVLSESEIPRRKALSQP